MSTTTSGSLCAALTWVQRCVVAVGLVGVIVGLVGPVGAAGAVSVAGPAAVIGTGPAATTPGHVSPGHVSPGRVAVGRVTTARAVRRAGERVVKVAAAQAGEPYRYGAEGPNAFDCSGLTSYAYRVGVHEIIPRTSAAQRAATRRISAAHARRGDLVFFYGTSGVYHVGIYAGTTNGHRMVWHAPYTGARVRKEPIWTSQVSYGRVR